MHPYLPENTKKRTEMQLGAAFQYIEAFFIQFLTFAFLSLFASFSLLFAPEKKEKKKSASP